MKDVEKFNELGKKVDQLLEENENLLSTIRQNIDELKSRCETSGVEHVTI